MGHRPDHPVPEPARPRADLPLHVCPACRWPAVHPTDWSEAGDQHWNISLRCPNCELRSAETVDDAQLDALEAELDRGAEALARDLTRLAQANMEDEVERFARALAADNILPMDF